MCNNCVAIEALNVSACQSAKCPAWKEGYEISYGDDDRYHPAKVPYKGVLFVSRRRGREIAMYRRGTRGYRRRLARRHQGETKGRFRMDYPRVFIRARPAGRYKGRKIRIGAEQGWTCEYQVRRNNEPWPKEWRLTNDLGGSMGELGFDVSWPWLPKPTKDWLRGKRDDLPTETEMKAFFKRRGGWLGHMASRKHGYYKRREVVRAPARGYYVRVMRMRRMGKGRSAVKVRRYERAIKRDATHRFNGRRFVRIRKSETPNPSA